MVFVLSKQKKPMDNCTPAKARLLLRDGLATHSSKGVETVGVSSRD